MNQETRVRSERLKAARGGLGMITLDAPAKLNAIDLEMIEAVAAALEGWREDPEVACVVLTGAGGRAFCAGGDIRTVAASLGHPEDARFELVERYFPAEYRLDHLIHTYPKPILAWGHGIVMGGGLGLLVGASQRVLTPASMVAMPEITIGLFPDVGASWFLNRMPGGSGLYCGLTGARLAPADAVFAGLADRILPEDAFDEVLGELKETRWTDDVARNHVLLECTLKPRQLPVSTQSPLQTHLLRINALTDYNRAEDVYSAIIESEDGDDWLAANRQRLRAGSPTSACVIHEQLRRARHLSLAEVFRMEVNMVLQFCRRHDFAEGVRALLIDKDQAPRWQPPRISEVDTQCVQDHFASPWGEGTNPLDDLGVESQ